MNTPDVTAAKKLQELKEQQAVIQAYLDGKVIEGKPKHCSTWGICSTPLWAGSWDYRVKVNATGDKV